MNGVVPPPAVMPVDRESWARELHLSNFVNTFYQYRDISGLPGVRRILVIGPGQGLDTGVLRWRGYHVTTIDIDHAFSPDHIGSVHDMSMFPDHAFDVAIASHVLEHLAVPYLDRAIDELARVARYSLVYLPVAGRHGQFRLTPGVGGWSWTCLWDLFNPWHRPSGTVAAYRERQHFWEVGMRGFRPGDLRRRFGRAFDVLSSYRNADWIYSYNFVLKSRRYS